MKHEFPKWIKDSRNRVPVEVTKTAQDLAAVYGQYVAEVEQIESMEEKDASLTAETPTVMISQRTNALTNELLQSRVSVVLHGRSFG